ncbi:MAG: hypothetical protein K8S97_03710 [Anaerolineae bacterium]|nr:hypothetical protein [Anaerolineae bacterium]
MDRTRRPLFAVLLGTGVLCILLALAACGTPDGSSTPTAAGVQITVNSPTTQYTPLPTPIAPPPGGQFGPITGEDYTPEPLHTALPASVSVQPCRAIVNVPELALYNGPDANATPISTVFERERLVVSQISTDGAGNVWGQTAAGWLPVTLDGAETAILGAVRECEILLGHTPNTTLAGLHVLNERSRDEVLTFVIQMEQAGFPVGTVKGLNGAEHILTEIKQVSPQTTTVYRSLLTADGMADCPTNIRDLPDPVITAERWYAGYQPYWARVEADYYEYMNECPAPLDWIAQFSIEMMKLAAADGRCLLLFSFPGGNPNMADFNQLLPAYEFAVNNPCAPGRTHGVAIHAYSLEDSRLVSESDVWIAMRHRILYERLLATVPQAAELPMYITEMGIGGGTIMPACDMIIRDVLQYTYQVEEDPYVQGFHLWNVGSGAQWYDVTPCLPELAEALIAYYSAG